MSTPDDPPTTSSAGCLVRTMLGAAAGTAFGVAVSILLGGTNPVEWFALATLGAVGGSELGCRRPWHPDLGPEVTPDPPSARLDDGSPTGPLLSPEVEPSWRERVTALPATPGKAR